MKTLLKNGMVLNVFTDTLVRQNILIEDEYIIGVGDYYTEADVDLEAGDVVRDIEGKYVTPGFIDGHIHIESTMLLPAELAKVALPRGTTSIVADPHEIANVCGTDGIKFMLGISSGLPMKTFITLPSCVPATPFDESGASLNVESLANFYDRKRVVGLAEMMNYPGVVAKDPDIIKKIRDAHDNRRVVDGHAPLLKGPGLDQYIAAGINSDHECSSFEEAVERIEKGQWVMIREGTAARNLESLLPLFDEPYNRRCLLVSDDKHPADLLYKGHIDYIIREAVKAGKSATTAIRMATIQAAQCFDIRDRGAIAPGLVADLLVLDDLDTVDVRDVYTNGRRVVTDKVCCDFESDTLPSHVMKVVLNSFYMDEIEPKAFHIDASGVHKCRVIGVIPGELITEEIHEDLDFDHNNGIDLERDILKLAVMERHMNTGHVGLGFIKGISLKKGAIAASVSHDSHNLIVIGTNDEDMAVAAERVRTMRGGMAVVADGEIIADMQLEVAGLMGRGDAKTLADKNARVRAAAHELGAPLSVEPFMNMAFVSLSVIPSLKMSTQGLVDVDKQSRVDLFV